MDPNTNPVENGIPASLPDAWDGPCVLGAGPAGLFAAQRLAELGHSVLVLDRMPSAGRKFLVAGRSGLNLTHECPETKFVERYVGGGDWAGMIREFSPLMLRRWAGLMGSPTFVGTSRRVFPGEMTSGGLLRRWIAHLKSLRVTFLYRCDWMEFGKQGRQRFRCESGEFEMSARAWVFCFGGASWPQTGSNAVWVSSFEAAGIEVASFVPSNCGWNVDWPHPLLCAADGLPLKNLAVAAGGRSVRGELLITKNGIEGGAIYALGPALRMMSRPEIEIDFKPDTSLSRMESRAAAGPVATAADRLRLSVGARHAVAAFGDPSSAAGWANSAKSLRIPLAGPRPIAEAISSAGGVSWAGLSEGLMLHARPGCFVCGEMLDWDAPTGGFLLQGCFSTAHRAAASCSDWLFNGDARGIR